MKKSKKEKREKDDRVERGDAKDFGVKDEQDVKEERKSGETKELDAQMSTDSAWGALAWGNLKPAEQAAPTAVVDEEEDIWAMIQAEAAGVPLAPSDPAAPAVSSRDVAPAAAPKPRARRWDAKPPQGPADVAPERLPEA